MTEWRNKFYIISCFHNTDYVTTITNNENKRVNGNADVAVTGGDSVIECQCRWGVGGMRVDGGKMVGWVTKDVIWFMNTPNSYNLNSII